MEHLVLMHFEDCIAYLSNPHGFYFHELQDCGWLETELFLAQPLASSKFVWCRRVFSKRIHSHSITSIHLNRAMESFLPLVLAVRNVLYMYTMVIWNGCLRMHLPKNSTRMGYLSFSIWLLWNDSESTIKACNIRYQSSDYVTSILFQETKSQCKVTC